MPFDVNEFLKDITLTDTQREALQSALSSPQVGKRLEEGYLRQQDYSRLASEAQSKIAEATRCYNDNLTWRQQEEARLQEERASLSTRVSGSEGGDPEYLPVAEFNKRNMEQQHGQIQVMSLMTRTAMEYLQEFGKVLDVDAVVNKATKEGTSFQIAYERLIQPERDAKKAKELEERIKVERAEAVKEYLANASIPGGNNTPFQGGPTHVLDAKPAEGQQFGWRAAAAAHTRDIGAGTVKSDG